MTFRCVDCAMVREDVLDANYNLSVRNYVQPEGYKWEGADVTRADWRGALVAQDRTMVKKGKRFVMEVENDDAS